MNKLKKYVKGLTQADLDALNEEVQSKRKELDQLIRMRDLLATQLCVDVIVQPAPLPIRSSNGNHLRYAPVKGRGNDYRVTILEYLVSQDRPIQGKRLLENLGIPIGSQTYLLNHKWFDKNELGFYVSDTGRAAWSALAHHCHS